MSTSLAAFAHEIQRRAAVAKLLEQLAPKLAELEDLARSLQAFGEDLHVEIKASPVIIRGNEVGGTWPGSAGPDDFFVPPEAQPEPRLSRGGIPLDGSDDTKGELVDVTAIEQPRRRNIGPRRTTARRAPSARGPGRAKASRPGASGRRRSGKRAKPAGRASTRRGPAKRQKPIRSDRATGPADRANNARAKPRAEGARQRKPELTVDEFLDALRDMGGAPSPMAVARHLDRGKESIRRVMEIAEASGEVETGGATTSRFVKLSGKAEAPQDGARIETATERLDDEDRKQAVEDQLRKAALKAADAEPESNGQADAGSTWDRVLEAVRSRPRAPAPLAKDLALPIQDVVNTLGDLSEEGLVWKPNSSPFYQAVEA